MTLRAALPREELLAQRDLPLQAGDLLDHLIAGQPLERHTHSLRRGAKRADVELQMPQRAIRSFGEIGGLRVAWTGRGGVDEPEQVAGHGLLIGEPHRLHDLPGTLFPGGEAGSQHVGGLLAGLRGCRNPARQAAETAVGEESPAAIHPLGPLDEEANLLLQLR